MGSQQRPEPPRRLPTGIKVFAWIGIVVGTWNVLCASVILVSPGEPGSLAAHPVVRCWGAMAIIVGGMSVPAAIGLLLRREWGRRGAIICLILIFATALAYALSFAALSWPEDGNPLRVALLVVPGMIGVAVTGIIVGLLIWYLSRDRIRKVFAVRGERPT